MTVRDECEVCGKTARIFIRDLKEVIEEGFRAFEPFGPWHAFCPDHQRDSEIVYVEKQR